MLTLGLDHSVPLDKIAEFANSVAQLVVEEVEPLLEAELRAARGEVIRKAHRSYRLDYSIIPRRRNSRCVIRL